MKRIIALLLCITVGLRLYSQDSIAVISSQLLEDILDRDDEQVYDFFSLYDELQNYLKNPININTANYEDLASLQLLSEEQIQDIINYRNTYGDFISKYELQTIPSLDFGTLSALVPLVTEGGESSNFSIKNILSESTSTLFLKWKNVLESRKGFEDGSYLGDPNHLFARYNFVSGRNVKAGFTLEKDPGEEFFKGSNPYGFDYFTGYIYLKDINKSISDISLGDYTVSMGQGLILHNSFGGGKSSFVTNIKKGGRSIRSYSSVNEANFFRGGAVNINLNRHVSTTLFASRKFIDGSLQNDTIIDTGFEQFTSFRIDGFHRTEREIANEKSVAQNAVGGIIKYANKDLQVSGNLLYQSFSKRLSTSDDLYKKYIFSGNKLINGSLDFSYRIKNLNTFGEFAISDNGGKAVIVGGLLSLGRYVSAAIVHRDYGKDYQVLNGNAFSESTLPINERGTYFGLKLHPTRKLTLSSYIDIWSHPWLRFQKDAPSDGREFLLKAEYYLKRKLTAYLQYRYEEKQKNGNITDTKIDPLVTTGQHRLRLHVSHTLNKDIQLRNRVEFSWFKDYDEYSKGFMLYQDIIYKPLGRSYSFTARYAIFDVDDFDARIYAYENDILYEFSIPFFSNKGSRFYLNWRQKIGRKLTLEGRYARTFYDDLDQIGSAGQTINGDTRSEIKVQLKYKI